MFAVACTDIWFSTASGVVEYVAKPTIASLTSAPTLMPARAVAHNVDVRFLIASGVVAEAASLKKVSAVTCFIVRLVRFMLQETPAQAQANDTS